MCKQPNGTPGKKLPAPSVKVSLHKLGIAEVDTAPIPLVTTTPRGY